MSPMRLLRIGPQVNGLRRITAEHLVTPYRRIGSLRIAKHSFQARRRIFDEAHFAMSTARDAASQAERPLRSVSFCRLGDAPAPPGSNRSALMNGKSVHGRKSCDAAFPLRRVRRHIAIVTREAPEAFATSCFSGLTRRYCMDVQ